ncbi:MAG: DNA-binding protein [Myxococcales bacterium]|nr:DNA-binding protein [Myxococcales bacterium]
MPALHIRNVDDAVIEALKRRAEAHHRSLEGELRAVLERLAFGTRTVKRKTLRLRLKTVAVGSTSKFGREEIYGDEGR